MALLARRPLAASQTRQAGTCISKLRNEPIGRIAPEIYGLNCLQPRFLAHEDKFITTPTYHVFVMYAAHQSAQALRTEVMSSRLSYKCNGKPAMMRGLNSSASLRDKTLTLTVTNSDLQNVQDTEIALRGATIKDIQVTTFSHAYTHAHHSFASPDVLKPQAGKAVLSGEKRRASFALASVTRLQCTLA